MSAPKPQRRDALLIDPSCAFRFADRRGREWVTDRFACVRSDLFIRPLTKDTAGYAPEALERGRRAGRRLLRNTRYAVTRELRLREPFDDETHAYAAGWLLIAANPTICDGLAAAGLSPRLTIGDAGDAYMTWWWRPGLNGKRALYAILMPKRRAG